MITGKSVAVGDVIQMPKLSGDQPFEVTEVKDGRVTVRRKRGMGSKRGRWWLLYDQVRQDGIRIQRAADATQAQEESNG